MGIFINVAVADCKGYEAGAEVVELFAFREPWVLDAAAFFRVGDASDLGDVGFDGGEGLMGGVDEEVEGVAVEVFAVFGGPEFVGNVAGFF